MCFVLKYPVITKPRIYIGYLLINRMYAHACFGAFRIVYVRFGVRAQRDVLGIRVLGRFVLCTFVLAFEPNVTFSAYYEYSV
ncbi:hypothetical protein QE152_g4020 [Popillia japonica]|uniref:Uncharacterized protein n=1 Tax=Popillia japonica TaxID=7064 RepID=A0AAW1MXH5_POPJA